MLKNISWEIYKNAEMRNSELDEFSKPVYWSISANIDLNTAVDSTKNLEENLKTIGYKYLKSDSFNGWVDA